jgi:cell division septation protein DedD
MMVESGRASFGGFGLSIYFSFSAKWWLSVILFLAMTCQAQPGLEAYNRGDLEAVRVYLAKGKGPAAEREFLRAALTTDADSAAKIYQQIANQYVDSPFGRLAVERLQQYYFAQGLYAKAEEMGKSLANLPNQNYRTDQPDTVTSLSSSESDLDSLERAKRKKPEVALIKTTPGSEPPASTKKSTVAGTYSLQLGAFSRPENLKRLKESLEKSGYTLEIYPAVISGKQLQAIRALGFKNEAAAQAAVREMKKKYGLNPILVPPGDAK